jgi:hypothetical protein
VAHGFDRSIQDDIIRWDRTFKDSISHQNTEHLKEILVYFDMDLEKWKFSLESTRLVADENNGTWRVVDL